MLNVGVDIVEISRFRKARFIDRVAEFFLTPNELSLRPKGEAVFQFYASRFALKEALLKALPETITYNDFEIVKVGERPAIKFLNSNYRRYKAAVSLSHANACAIGFAVVSS